MRRLKILKDILGHISHPIESFRFMGSSFAGFILHGGVSVETSFEYQPAGMIEKYWFRTTIQLDADIINTVPRPDLYPDNPNWQQVFERAYQTHQDRLKQFITRLDGIRIIAWVIGSILSLLPIISIWTMAPSEIRLHIFRWAYPAVWLILAYLIRRYLLRTIFRLTVKIVGFWIKKKMTPSLESSTP